MSEFGNLLGFFLSAIICLLLVIVVRMLEKSNSTKEKDVNKKLRGENVLKK